MFDTYNIKTILKESIPAEIVASMMSIFAGVILNLNNETLFLLPGILIVVPSYVNMGGGIVSILSCRISSALHMGTIRPQLKNTKTLDRNVLVTFIDSFLSFIAIGFIASALNYILGVPSIGFIMLPAILLIAGMLSVCVLSVCSIIFTYVSYSKGIDPDNWVIPILTSIGDFVSVFLLFFILNMVI